MSSAGDITSTSVNRLHEIPKEFVFKRNRVNRGRSKQDLRLEGRRSGDKNTTQQKDHKRNRIGGKAHAYRQTKKADDDRFEIADDTLQTGAGKAKDGSTSLPKNAGLGKSEMI